MKIFAKSWAIGVAAGLIFGALLAAVSLFDLAESTPFESILLFFGSLPVFITIKLLPDVPEFFLTIIFFIYWIVLGGLIGWGIRKGKAGILGVTLLIAVLFFAHFEAYITMQREIDDAVSAFVEFIRMLGGPFPRTQ